MFRPDITVVVDRSLNINNDSCGADLEGRPEMSDVYPLSGISGLSFDSTLLSPLLFLCLLPLLFLCCLFFCLLALSLDLFFPRKFLTTLRDGHFGMALVQQLRDASCSVTLAARYHDTEFTYSAGPQCRSMGNRFSMGTVKGAKKPTKQQQLIEAYILISRN